MYQNVTLKLDTNLLREIKIYAIKRGTSLSRLMVDALTNMAQQAKNYEKAKKAALLCLQKGYKLGGGPYYLSRQELHQRHDK